MGPGTPQPTSNCSEGSEAANAAGDEDPKLTELPRPARACEAEDDSSPPGCPGIWRQGWPHDGALLTGETSKSGHVTQLDAAALTAGAAFPGL